jgi:IstB-like ATP binding protein
VIQIGLFSGNEMTVNLSNRLNQEISITLTRIAGVCSALPLRAPPGEVFPNAACVVSLVDRLIHHSEVIGIEGESYRLKDARARSAEMAAKRKRAKS